jgi:hypothetical protein
MHQCDDHTVRRRAPGCDPFLNFIVSPTHCVSDPYSFWHFAAMLQFVDSSRRDPQEICDLSRIDQQTAILGVTEIAERSCPIRHRPARFAIERCDEESLEQALFNHRRIPCRRHRHSSIRLLKERVARPLSGGPSGPLDRKGVGARSYRNRRRGYIQCQIVQQSAS